jgi:aminoglycoside phosphotransferase (APT) family kinase protein
MTIDSPEDFERLADTAGVIASQVAGEGVRAVRPIRVGVMTHKYEVTNASGEKLVVRFYPPARSLVLNYEPDILRRCRAHGMRVPELIADSRNGPSAALAYMVYRMLPGTSLQERLGQIGPRQLGALCADVVAQLEQLAELPMNGFGDVLSGQHARSGSWHEFMRDAFERGLEVARDANVLDRHLLKAFGGIERNLDRFDEPRQAVLAWGDLSPENIIVDEHGRFVGLIDFEGVVSAEIDLGLGFLQARYAGTAFYRQMAYNWPAKRSEQPRVELYVVVRALRLLRHAREPLPTGVARDPIEVALPNLRPAATRVVAWLDS